MSARLLVVEDDPATGRMVTMALRAAGYGVDLARTLAQAESRLEESSFDLWLCDLYLPDGNGLELLAKPESSLERPPVIVFTAQGSVETAVEAIKRGAFDYLAKPFKIQDLLNLVERALAGSRSAPPEENGCGESLRPSLLVGNSPPMVDLYKKIALAARSDSPVLITGETGTGKELVARSLHLFSERRDRPFVPVNCGALTETLLESELFGHERGAFTGAVAARKGLFEQAQGGTLFLDEITETSPGFQVKLLRALQEGEVRPVGGNRLIRVDVRIVAATNQDIEAAKEEGRFRRDLFYRLSVVRLEVPPLRHRREDIPRLANHFLRQINQHLGRNLRLTEEAVRLLQQYDWPGNVRELENVIERVAVLKTDPFIVPTDLEFLSAPETAGELGLNELDMVEREKILQILRETRGNKTEAARRLGIERKSLYRKARRLGIDLDRFV
ncbi:MAG TPA: sigma-54 dependent transcriptional regulator [Acidobacteriota bacterium]|nr:sigma-54 dependent transcriptional regulator [Acidobacteriota bacterium]HRR26724.1 sigma-54 dependent transcriptional regulator [Acidobacteriota bacterium]HRR56558.1 sigma-54 dependent transcriptional regulator [Acidobacteriota bacterium]HRV07140.1 sigma-54 dependent transcriptional regulator [Acidobacteriota bacterium]